MSVDTGGWIALQYLVPVNRHAWRNWIDDRRALPIFDDYAELLGWAWERDQKSPKSFPLNTDNTFADLKAALKELKSGPFKGKRGLPAPPPPPETFAELIDERVLAAVYEDQNTGSYKDALKKAAKLSDGGFRTFHKLLRAFEAAYLVCYSGDHATPKPKVNFLHRRLLEITELEILQGLTLSGLVGFFNDMCPCGKKHRVDAIRKLKSRALPRSKNASKPA